MTTHTRLVGVFDDNTKVEHAITQLQQSGIATKDIRRVEKNAGWDISHAVPNRKDTPEEMKPDFTGYSDSPTEVSYYEDAYQAGYILLAVDAGSHQQEVLKILQENGSYNYQTAATPSEATGAMTPGMRGEDSTQINVANSASGDQAATIDPAIVESDIQHAERILQEKYQERAERGLEE